MHKRERNSSLLGLPVTSCQKGKSRHGNKPQKRKCGYYDQTLVSPSWETVVTEMSQVHNSHSFTPAAGIGSWSPTHPCQTHTSIVEKVFIAPHIGLIKKKKIKNKSQKPLTYPEYRVKAHISRFDQTKSITCGVCLCCAVVPRDSVVSLAALSRWGFLSCFLATTFSKWENL